MLLASNESKNGKERENCFLLPQGARAFMKRNLGIGPTTFLANQPYIHSPKTHSSTVAHLIPNAETKILNPRPQNKNPKP